MNNATRPAVVSHSPEGWTVVLAIPGTEEVVTGRAVFVSEAAEWATRALMAELEVKTLIESRGFTYHPCHNPKSEYAGLRFSYEIPGALVLRPRGWGFTPLEAARNVLALVPQSA